MTAASATAFAGPVLAPLVSRTAAGRRAPAATVPLASAGAQPTTHRFAARTIDHKAGLQHPHAALRAGTA